MASHLRCFGEEFDSWNPRHVSGTFGGGLRNARANEFTEQARHTSMSNAAGLKVMHQRLVPLPISTPPTHSLTNGLRTIWRALASTLQTSRPRDPLSGVCCYWRTQTLNGYRTPVLKMDLSFFSCSRKCISYEGFILPVGNPFRCLSGTIGG